MLATIIARTREKVKGRKAEHPLEPVRRESRSLSSAIMGCENLPVVAEIKRASPSAGRLTSSEGVEELAEAMVRGGAVALSVLTEEDFFAGHASYITRVSRRVDVPILRKDFIVDEYQLLESAHLGADAVLLIAKVLGKRLKHFVQRSLELGLEPLVEVHDEEELELALESGAEMIGINNRDLETLEVDLSVTEKLAPKIPDDFIVVSESGIRTPEDARRVVRAGADAILVGTALMRAPDPEAKVREFVGAMA